MAMRLLALHAGYGCRHRGVCCTEPWAIPVDDVRRGRLVSALSRGSLRPSHTTSAFFEAAEGIDADSNVVVGRTGRDCVFFEQDQGRLCAIHRDVGHDVLPVACQHFPRVVVVDPRGVTLSLSHVCPTAGELLVADVNPWNRIVHHGRVVTEGMQWAGLDARESLPPQVHASLLWDWDSMTAFEEGALDVLGGMSPERALGAIADVANELARHEGRELRPRVLDAFDRVRTAQPLVPDVLGLTALAEGCARDGSLVDAAPGDVDLTATAAPWASVAAPVSRYLAARLIASAVPYHALDVRVWSGWLQAAYSVLRSAFARRVTAAGSSHAALQAAAADADRLLVHRIHAARFASSLLERSGLRC